MMLAAEFASGEEAERLVVVEWAALDSDFELLVDRVVARILGQSPDSPREIKSCVGLADTCTA